MSDAPKFNEELTQVQLAALPLGSEVSDWEGDILEKEAADGWRYKHYPMRNDKRTFDSEVLHQAYGPVKLVKFQAPAGGTENLTPQKLSYLAQPLNPEEAGRLLYSVNVYEHVTVAVPGPAARDHARVAEALRDRAAEEELLARGDNERHLTDQQVEALFPIAPPLPASKHAGLGDAR